MSSLRGGKDPVISSSPVGNDDNTSWPVDADVVGQVNSSLEESSTNHWRVKERVLSLAHKAFGGRPRNIALHASSEVSFCYFSTHANDCRYPFLPFTFVMAEATNAAPP